MHVVMLGKIIPVLPLRGAQCSGTVTDRADIPQSREYGAADEIRAVLYTGHGIGEGFIHFKCNNLVFFPTGAHHPAS